MRILVHVHVFHKEIWPEIRDLLCNLDQFDWDLYITTVHNDFCFDKSIGCSARRVSVNIIENKGYDVGPFIWVLQHVDTDKYDYVIKLHTKRNVPYDAIIGKYCVGGSMWRRKSLSFIRSKNNINLCLSSMESNTHTGMCGDRQLIMEDSFDSDSLSLEGARIIMDKHFSYTGNIKFIAGTMFIAKMDALRPILKIGVSLNDFSESSSDRKSSLAHALERVFGALIIAQGFEIEDCFTKKYINLFYLDDIRNFSIKLLLFIRRFIFQYKKTKHRKIIKILKIPVYSKKFYD